MNIPAVLVLERLGLEQGQQGLLAFGLANAKTVNQTGLALALGSHEVGLADLTNAYRTLANGGMHGALKWTTKVGDQAVPIRLISETSAKTVNSILTDVAPRNRAFGEFNALNTSFTSMSKTGTSNGARDNWAIGSTARHTVGVWIGNFEHDAMRDIYGPAGAGLAWRVIMEHLKRLP
jgi:penicillin-binding protein 1C